MMGLCLNLTSSVLYMANYNLVVPSIRSFLAHVGGDAAASGVVIGCCDLAALCATFGASTGRCRVFWEKHVSRAMACCVPFAVAMQVIANGPIQTSEGHFSSAPHAASPVIWRTVMHTTHVWRGPYILLDC